MSDAEPSSLVADSPCVRCGYNLRSHRPEEHCPECGLGIARSLALGRALHESRPAWISSLAWAAWLLLVAQLMPVAALMLMALRDLLTQMLSVPFILREITIGAGYVLGTLAFCLGSWLLTRPENPYASRNPLRYLAIPLRICCLGPLLSASMALASSILIWWWFHKNPFVGLPNSWRITLNLLQTSSGYCLFLFLPCPLLQFILLRRLALRVFNARLIEHTTIVGCGYPISVLLLFVWSSTVNIGVANKPVGYVATLFIWVAAALFWLWSMYVYRLFSKAFARAAREARVAWQRADGARPAA